MYIARAGDNGSSELGLKNAELLSISKNGELAVRLNSIVQSGYAYYGTLARVPLSGGSPREVLDNVRTPNGPPTAKTWRSSGMFRKIHIGGWNIQSAKSCWTRSIGSAIPAFRPTANRSRSPTTKILEATTEGPWPSSIPMGTRRSFSTGWASVEGIQWSPSGDELWFPASDSGASNQLRAVTLGGKVRTIANVPGGMWFEDLHSDGALMITHQQRVDIRGMPPGGKQELISVGSVGPSCETSAATARKYSSKKKPKAVGRTTPSSFAIRTARLPCGSEKVWRARSLPMGNGYHASPKNGLITLVPTGAGEPPVDPRRYHLHGRALYAGRQSICSRWGIEPGHGARDYLIDVDNGNSTPVTPEGVIGLVLSPDGRSLP